MSRAALVALVLGVGGSLASASFFDIYGPDRTLTGGPPYPSDPPIVFPVVQSGETLPIEEVSFCYTLQPEIASRVRASSLGGGGGGGAGVLEYFIDDQGAQSAQSARIDGFFDVYGLTGGRGTVTGHTCTYADSFFDIFVELTIPDVGPQQVRIHGQAGSGVHFGPVTPQMYADSFFDIFTELTIPDPISPEVPVMTQTITITPEPASLSLLAVGGLMVLRRRRSGRP